MPLTTSIRVTYAPERWRLAKRWSGVIGCSARRSVITKDVSRAPLRRKEAMVMGSPHPEDAARTNP